jgi:hypothetical protein
MLGKNANIDRVWEFIELEPADFQTAMKKLHKVNLLLYEACIDEAHGIIQQKKLTKCDENVLKIADALFSKLGTNSYTILSVTLDKKIHMLKREPKDRPPAQVVKEWQGKKKDLSPSTVEDTFKKIAEEEADIEAEKHG